MNKALKGDRLPSPPCGNKYVVKSGVLLGKQRFLCRKCNYQFTLPKLSAKPGNIRAIALTLYSYGLTMEEISALLNVSVTAVHYWMLAFMDRKIQRPDGPDLVTIPLSDIMKLLPNGNNNKRAVVLVPVNDRTGEIAGMINIPAAEMESAVKETGGKWGMGDCKFSTLASLIKKNYPFRQLRICMVSPDILGPIRAY